MAKSVVFPVTVYKRVTLAVKKAIPYKKWYFNPETKDMEISFKDGKEGLRWLANEVLKDTNINITRILK